LLKDVQAQNLIVLVILIMFFTYFRTQFGIEYIKDGIFGSRSGQLIEVGIGTISRNSLTDISRPGFLLVLIQNQCLLKFKHFIIFADFYNSA